MVLDYLGLSKLEDEDYESLRRAAIEFVNMVKQNPELVEDKLMEFITYQHQRVESGEIKPITIRNYIKATKTLCVMNRVKSIAWELISKGLPSGRASGNDKAPTVEELRKLIGDDLRLKVIVCIMSSCGFRIAAWNYLKVKHIVPIKRGDVVLASIKVYAGQNVGKRKEYYSLISPEAYQVFQDYLDSRAAAGEKITDESWVLRDKWQLTGRRPTSGNHGGGNYGLASAPKQLKASGVKSNIDDTLWKVGLRITAAKHHEFKECHGFRKYFKTYAQRTMKPESVEKLMGHAGNWSDAAYNRPLEDWLIEDYLKAVPDLTIYREDQVTELKKQIGIMEQDFKSNNERVVEQRRQEVEVIQTQVDAMRKQITTLQTESEGFKKIAGLVDMMREAVDLAKIVDAKTVEEAKGKKEVNVSFTDKDLE